MVRAEIAWFPLYLWILCAVTTLLICSLALVFRRHRTTGAAQEKNTQEINSQENNARTGRLFGPFGQARVAWFIVGVASIPWLTHFVYKWLQYANAWNFQGEPLEIVIVASLQYMTLAMALTTTSTRNRRLTITMGFFLMLFSVVISSQTWVYPVAMLYGVMAIWWLMGDHWEKLQSRFVGQSRSSSLPIRSGVLVATLLLLGSAATLAVMVSPESVGLTGWLPTSGGKDWSDPSARSGVGDGDMLVAARDQAFSFGPVESDLFIEDQQPTLYDMISELDGLPPKKKKSESAVGIDGSLGKTNHEKLANTESSSREFSAIRQAPRVDRMKLPDKNSPSLIYYNGPAPQRLAIETYDRFDGVSWKSKSSSETDSLDNSESMLADTPSTIAETKLVNRSGKPWISFRTPSASQPSRLGSSSPKLRWASAIKVIRFVSPRVPTPDEFESLHIDRIDRPEFFAWTKDGIVTMVDREQVPALTIVRLDALQRDLHTLRNTEKFLSVLSMRDVETPNKSNVRRVAGDTETLSKMVKEMVSGVPVGWEQVEAIETALKQDFVLDSQAVVPDDTSDAVSHFLQVKRGPAYLFATTTAMLVRSLGYDCRLANGFYIPPESFDAASGQYLIGKKQLHWWPQVSIDGKVWISIEPTPGYLAPSENWTFFQRCQWAWTMALRLIRNHPWHCLAALFAIAAGYRMRIQLIDSAMTSIAHGMGLRSLEHQIGWSLWLLDRRAELAGCPRPISKTHRQWFQPMAVDSISDVLNAQDERLYSPSHCISLPNLSHENPNKRLRASLKRLSVKWSVKRMKDIARGSTQALSAAP